MSWLKNPTLVEKLDYLQNSMNNHLDATLDYSVLGNLGNFLQGKVITITGASGAWGSNMAAHAAQAGAHLVLTYNTNPIDRTTYEGYSGKVYTYQVDLAEERQVHSFWDIVEQEVMGKLDLPKIHGLYMTHGIEINDRVFRRNLEERDRLYGVNRDSIHYLIRHGKKNFADDTSILFPGSITTTYTYEGARKYGQLDYRATKIALRGIAADFLRTHRSSNPVVVEHGIFESMLTSFTLRLLKRRIGEEGLEEAIKRGFIYDGITAAERTFMILYARDNGNPKYAGKAVNAVGVDVETFWDLVAEMENTMNSLA